MLSAAAPGPGGIEVAYYVIASVIAIGTVAIGGGRLMVWLKGRWTQEGQQRAESTRIIAENTRAAMANTEAIAGLSVKLAEFATSVRSDISGHEHRITRLEMGQRITRENETRDGA